jgi:hypothetical protein
MSKSVKKTAAKSSNKTAAKAAKTTAKAAATKKSAGNARHPILDSHTITVVSRKLPFNEAAKVRIKNAMAVLACNGKTVEDAKKKGADSWIVRELIKHKLITVKPAKAA